ncbi:DUF1440 domain-containing protein [Enterovirga sp.]|jgi:putative membrane protein|uniref:DUF1440 domain-containing protein n=1 Tax=Enterovirga sp. TaxID=2026350 RepID=UPI00260176F9|nr:DUF1440 domain-containing protein [Enterovirga sp.]MDB5590912.1 hypothetical protein [Enterovirga sp.]
MTIRPEDLAKGVLAGAVAGVVASVTMDLFQRGYAAMSSGGSGREGGPEQDEPSTVKVANRIAMATAGHRVPDAYGAYAGEAVHLGTGAALGALYGAAAEAEPRLAAGGGALYGGTIWAVLDQGVVPGLRLGPPPRDQGAADYAYSLASHVVFGVALEATRRLLRRL